MDFVKWSARYGKNRFYKILLFFILFCIFTFFFKSCNVKALTYIQDAQADVYFKSQYCTESESISGNYNGTPQSGKRFNCETGPSYKFAQLLNNSSSIEVPFLITENQLFNNMTFKINFENPVEITSTNRYIVLRAPWGNSNISQGTFGTFSSYFPLNGIRPNGTSTDLNPSLSTYFNQVEYCNYSDGSTTYKCNNVTIAPNTGNNRFVFYIDIPVGTIVSNITLFFGNNNIQSSYDIYSRDVAGWFTAMTTTQNLYNSNITTNFDSFDTYKQIVYRLNQYKGNHYNIYGKDFFSGSGLAYYRYAPSGPTFKPSTSTENLYFETNIPSYNGSPVYYFANATTEDTNYYNGLVNSIEQELNPPSEDSWFTDSFNGFLESNESNSFITLFNSLLTYPLSKFTQQNQMKLTWTNVNGAEILSPAICKGVGIAGDYGPGIQLSWHGASFDFPCIHYDVYSKLTSDNFAFYPTTLNGANISGGNSHNLYSIIKIILDGVLIYFMFITCLDIYKYILDSDRKEIEVLDL